MKKSFLSKRPQQGGEMSLQITSMADIFMILLVFMLKSFATGVLDVQPTAGTTMPKAVAEAASINALKVEVAKDTVLVEGQPVAKIKDFEFVSGDLEANGASKSLNEALEKERKRQMLIAGKNADVKLDARVIVVADERAPYQTIKTVLASAAINGYTDFKLAVVNPN